MKIVLSQLQHEWIFIFALIYCIQMYYWQKDWLFLFLIFFILIRIIYLRNKYTSLLAIALISLSLILSSLKAIQQNQVSQLPLQNYQESFIIQVDPIESNRKEKYISGYGEAWVTIANESYRFPVYYQYYHQGEHGNFNETEIDLWQVEGSFDYPEPARNFGSFDFKDYLANQGIFWQVRIKKINSQRISNNFYHGILALRNELLNYYQQLSDLPWLALHNKLILNLNSDYYRHIQDTLQNLGIVHLFALSGFHLVFIRKYLSYCLLRMGFTIEQERWLVWILLSLYLYITRFPIGLMRAFFMYYLRQISKYYQLSLAQMDIFAITGITIILVQPQIVTSIAFQLSFLMTYIILIFNQSETRGQGFIEEFKLSLSCLLFSWPILIQISHTWNFIQLMVVILMNRIFSLIIMPAIAVTSILAYLPKSILIYLLWPLNQVSLILLKYINLPRGPDIFTFRIGILNYLELTILFAVAIFFVYKLSKQGMIAYRVVLLIYLSLIFIKPYIQIKDRINLIDVGQGDAVLLSLAYNQGQWLIDTGGKARSFGDQAGQIDLNYASYNLIPALEALGVQRLSGLVITHMDLDHVGNLISLAQVIPIERLYVSEYALADSLWHEFVNSLAHIPITIVPAGEAYVINQKLILYSLSQDQLNNSKSLNNDTSLSVQFHLGPLNYLGTGDLSAEFEPKLLQIFPNIKADILKLGHHGSRTSTSDSLLDQLKPFLAINSAGKDNSYGHPHPEVIEKLNARQIILLSSHEYGALELNYHPYLGFQIKTVIKE